MGFDSKISLCLELPLSPFHLLNNYFTIAFLVKLFTQKPESGFRGNTKWFNCCVKGEPEMEVFNLSQSHAGMRRTREKVKNAINNGSVKVIVFSPTI